MSQRMVWWEYLWEHPIIVLTIALGVGATTASVVDATWLHPPSYTCVEPPHDDRE
jgi:hypothetical protein